jgi:hypothetical protein
MPGSGSVLLLYAGAHKISWNISFQKNVHRNMLSKMPEKNPLARRPGLVISTFGLAEIISCMADGLVKKHIGSWQIFVYLLIFIYVIIGKTGNSRSRFRNPIPVFHFSKLPVSRHLLKLFYDELRSFSTFFTLNFDSGTGNDYFRFCR